MRHKRAVEMLRLLAEGCEEIGHWPPEDELYLVAMYAFGDVLEGTDPAGSRTRDGAPPEWSGPDRAAGAPQRPAFWAVQKYRMRALARIGGGWSMAAEDLGLGLRTSVVPSGWRWARGVRALPPHKAGGRTAPFFSTAPRSRAG